MWADYIAGAEPAKGFLILIPKCPDKSQLEGPNELLHCIPEPLELLNTMA